MGRFLNSSRARFFASCAAGGVLAMAVFAWMVLLGQADLFAPEGFAGFYEAQARSLLHGNWAVDRHALMFERFNIDGHFYTYFGPWPALLRMPVVFLTDHFDSRLSRVSMLLGFAVFLGFSSRLAWQVRVLVRGDGPPTRATLVAAAGFVFVAGCGSTTLFLASRAWVYHEAIMWSVALSVAAYSFLIAYLVAPRRLDLVLTGMTATLAIMSRATVGAGPVIALGVLLGLQLIQRLADRRRANRAPGTPPEPTRPGRVLGVSATVARQSPWVTSIWVVIPLALYAYVNHSKFGSLYGLPLDKQDLLLRAPDRQAALAANSSLLGPEYAPTNLLQYFRPDAVGFDRLFPWVTFSGPPRIVAGATFDTIEPSASITAISTLLLCLAVVGAVAVVRARQPAGGEATAAVLRLPILAAVLATVGTITLGVQTLRYEGDFVPALVISAAAGLFWLPALIEHRRRVTRVVIGIGVIALGAWSVWATFSVALLYQRAYSGYHPDSPRTGFLSFQLDVHDALGPGDVNFERGEVLPQQPDKERFRTTEPIGTLFVVDDCDALYRSGGRYWESIETTPHGSRRWRVTFDGAEPGTREPLWSTTSQKDPITDHVLWANWLDDHTVRFEFEWITGQNTNALGERVLDVEPGESYDLDVRLDPRKEYVEVKYGDELLLQRFPESFVTDTPSRRGRQPYAEFGATSFGGTIRRVSSTPLCDRLVEEE